jgi:hypothetical protein
MRLVLSLMLAFTMIPVTLGETQPSEHGVLSEFDARVPADRSDRARWILRSPTLQQIDAAESLRRSRPGVSLQWEGLSGSPGWFSVSDDVLYRSSTASGFEGVAREFLQAYRQLFGLREREMDQLRLSSVVRLRGGGSHVHLVQAVEGIEVFGSHVVVNLDKDGAVRSAGSRLFGDVAPAGEATRDPADAVGIAVDYAYPGIAFSGRVAEEERGADRLVEFLEDGFGFPPSARLVLFAEREGARLAWQVEVAEPSLFTSYRILIDATDGAVLFLENLTSYAEATHIVGTRPVPKREEYAPTNYIIETIPTSTPESPLGWISGSGTSLEGNNATSHIGYWSEPGLTDPAGIFDYPFNTSESALVSSWWLVNEAHDRFYAIGFDEEAGNFQRDNFGLGGLGGDPVETVQYVTGPRNPQFFTSAPDGTAVTLNAGWGDCRFCGDHDGILGRDVTDGDFSPAYLPALVFHEYTHGVTGRLAGGPAATGCANADFQSGALNEATSDLFGQSFHDPHPRLRSYSDGTGVGRDPRNDLTYENFCSVRNGGCEIHDDGMIWSGTLWDLRDSFLAIEPDNGLDSFHRLVLESWASVVCDPTFLQMKEAMLAADATLYGGAHQSILQNVFAARGMGENASTTGNADTSPTADFTVPAAFACSPPAQPTGLTATASSDNRIDLSYTASGASGVQVWRESLDNPHDRPALIGRTDNRFGFVDDTVQGGTSYRYHVVALGEGGVPCSSAESDTADGTATGACEGFPLFDPHLTIVEDDPSCGAVTLSWNPASPGCAGDSIVYNVYRGPTPGFDPSERLLVGRTTTTTFDDLPGAGGDYPENQSNASYADTPHYLVVAQSGTLQDPVDHRIPEPPSQVLQWVPAAPTGTRTTVAFWDFESGDQGWTTDNSANPSGGWTRSEPAPTWFAGALLAPDEAPGGSGAAWVTGDGGNGADRDCDGENLLISPVWDGTGGATILSFDYWAWVHAWKARLRVVVDNGTDQVGVDIAGLNTTQPFDADARHSWQRAEINLADHLAPSSTMSVTFRSFCGSPALVELGVDNVRVESATACSRSGLTLDSVNVDDTPAGWGNGNGVLEPGETARLLVRVKNDGADTAFAPAGFVSTDFPGVTVHEATDSYPDVAPEATADSAEQGFTITVPQTTACDDTLTFDFRFVDAAGTTTYGVWNASVSHLVTDRVFEDDFETDKGWSPQGVPGSGLWMRGDPVGTTNFGNPANPEDDSPNDVGSQCYVTENGIPGGRADTNDVDGAGTTTKLRSPDFDLAGYKAARILFDLWYYDDSTANPGQDYAEQRVFVVNGGTGTNHRLDVRRNDPTIGWIPRSIDLTRSLPMTSPIGINFFGSDASPDSVVEVGIDNFVLEADRAQCDPTGVTQSPNGVGSSLRIAKSGDEALLTWSPSAIDPAHDGAAYYRVFVSMVWDSGYLVEDTATTTSATRPLARPSEFYRIVSVNAAGTSGDEPVP